MSTPHLIRIATCLLLGAASTACASSDSSATQGAGATGETASPSATAAAAPSKSGSAGAASTTSSTAGARAATAATTAAMPGSNTAVGTAGVPATSVQPAQPKSNTSAGAGAMSAAAAGAGVASAGAAAAAGAGGMTGGANAVSGEPLLPPITDPAKTGPFMVMRIDSVPGLSSHTLLVPDKVSANGKYPVVIWTNGNSATLSTYASYLNHIASHGFFVIGDKDSLGADRQAEVASQIAAIDWAFAENERAGSDYMGKLDTERVAVMGHSLGSLASFGGASDPRIATSIHYSGGITDNPVGFDPMWLQKLHNPAAFLCGGNDTTAGPSCEKDFAMAKVPVFYGKLLGADHIGPFLSQPAGGQYGRAGVAWLRWRLANDDSFRSWFVGDSCTLCGDGWDGMQRGLD